MTRIRVRLQTRELNLAFEGSRAFFERHLSPLLGPLAGRRGGEARPAGTLAEPAREPAPGYVPPSDRFGVFQRQCDLGETEAAGRVAAYAFFLWNYEKKEVFAEEEVEGCFRADGTSVPADPAALYGELLGRRMLAPGAKEHTWRLTGKGRDYVRHHLLSA